MLLGLDIRTGIVRMVQMRREKIEFCSELAIANSIFSAGKIMDFVRLAERLSDIRKKWGRKKIACAIHLPIHLVYIGTLTFPAEHLKKELSRIFPNMVSDLNYDYQNHTYVAARSGYINEYIKCLAACGLQVKMIDVDIFALIRFLMRAEKPKAKRALCVLENGFATLLFFDRHSISLHQVWELLPNLSVQTQIDNKLKSEHQFEKLHICDLNNAEKFYIAAGLAMRCK